MRPSSRTHQESRGLTLDPQDVAGLEVDHLGDVEELLQLRRR